VSDRTDDDTADADMADLAADEAYEAKKDRELDEPSGALQDRIHVEPSDARGAKTSKVCGTCDGPTVTVSPAAADMIRANPARCAGCNGMPGQTCVCGGDDE